MNNVFSNKVTSVIIAVIVCALWGSLYPFVKIGYSAFQIVSSDIPTIMLFAGCRFVVSGVMLFTFYSSREKKVSIPPKKYLILILLSSFASIILHYFLTYTALAFGQGSKSAIIKQVGFLFLSCFAFLFIKEDKFLVKKLISGILGFLGIVITSFDNGKFSFAFGDVFLVLASFCSVISMILSKEIVKKVNPLYSTAFGQLFGGIVLCVVGMALGGRIAYIDINAVLVFAYICLSSIIAYALWSILIKYNDVSKLSIIKFTEPLFAVILSGIFLGENIFKLNYLIALILIFAAILLVNLKHNDQGEKVK